MSSKQNDQAEALRQAIEEVTEHQNEEKEQIIQDQDEQLEQGSVEIDILNLPPRNEVHKDKRKIRFKLNLRLLRFLFIVVLLLALTGVIVWFI
ncbi:hypothetical protein [Oceanobacillus jeddahense]|uniref:Uncharacterized protein n=1 Tax=Oceanobacillus jeddahense TaxID=1462527 RepID=A0ABY5JKX7_9BACI|nr:hypothetical protein [Oceanobacillus jeddahense]UUI00943.1 hypothetical protein NP439_12725 [Oceanobacillus jeddahense]